METLDAPEATDYDPPADATKWASFSLTITNGSGTKVISEATGIAHRYKWMAAPPISLDLCEECAARCFKEISEVITQRDL
ncbi:MAG: hypothetical protein ACREOD_06490 [Candidatus Dormibacteria bacterium]